MLLTLSTTHEPATDLGYLLHKNPAKLHSFELAFGKAHVFYPEATAERCTVALLHVNDRPYVLSSFLSVAMGRAFGTAMAGRSKGRHELADLPIPLTANLTVVACRAGEGLIRELFEPLGYSVAAQQHPLDEKLPDWGEGPYYSVTLAGTFRLQDLLNHLYVLVPVLDAEKHYWIGQDEVEKLLRKGEGWLGSHPHKETIVRRYLPRQRQLAREALARLTDEDNLDPDATEEAPAEQQTRMEEPIRLWQQRMGGVVAVLRSAEAKRILDLGCGEGKLLRALLEEKSFTEIIGMDVSYRCLEIASQRLKLDRMPTKQKERLKLMHGSLIYRDHRLPGTMQRQSWK
jgi:3' terminal RNA ribose 2'-O-methyltransferase Hen1